MAIFQSLINRINANWLRQNEAMDYYQGEADKIRDRIVQEHPDIEDDLLDFSNNVTRCSALAGARLGMKGVEDFIDHAE